MCPPLQLRKLWELIASRDPSRRKADFVVGGDADPARAKFDRVKLDASLREVRFVLHAAAELSCLLARDVVCVTCER